jgi:hypothetical protein
MFTGFFRDPVPDMSIAFQRADAGARYLDQLCGDGWHRRIDVGLLNVGSATNSLLRQLTRHKLFRIVFDWRRDSVALGFSCGLWDVLFFAPPPWVSRSFHRLTAAWKLVIEKRYALDQLPQPRPASVQSARHDRGDSDTNCFTCLG